MAASLGRLIERELTKRIANKKNAYRTSNKDAIKMAEIILRFRGKWKTDTAAPVDPDDKAGETPQLSTDLDALK